jgi:protoporphyrinogen oxidase
MRIAVIGAGPAGITAAYKLSGEIKSGKVTRLDVYEASSQVGGLSKSLQMWDQTVDLGPHRFFSHDPKINGLWLEVVGKDFDIVNRQTRIFYKNTFFDYPIQASNALKGLGFFEAARCVLSYFWMLVFPYRKADTFESWVSNRFGKRLYQIFFKTYSEKLWGIKCDNLDSDFASQRIKKLSLFEAVKNALFQGGSKKHATLVDQFAYPLKGTGSVYEKMAEVIRSNDGNIHLNTGVEKVITSGRKVTGLELNNGSIIGYDHIISSMPLSQLVLRLPETPYDIKELANSLKFRNTILVYLLVDKPDLFPDQWLYIHSADLKIGRLSNFRNWVPQLNGDKKETILCLEYWCNFEDPEWSLDDREYIRLGSDEVTRTGLLGDGKVLDGKVIRLPRCYPVYFRGYKDKLKPVEEYLDTIIDLQAIGRYGAYKYNNQDHSILMGIMAAENILEGKKNNLWSINTDYEVYQESSIITKTGLVSSIEKN